MERLRLKVNDEIELVQLLEEDAEIVFELIEKNRSHLEPWLPWAPKTKTVENERQFLHSVNTGARRTGEIVFGIYVGSALSGAIGINVMNKDSNSAELGYWLDAEASGKGVMTSAVVRLMQYCFEELALNRVGIYASVKNTKSRAVIERAGCSFEGILRAYVRVNNEYHDAAMYSMLASDFKKIS